MVNSIPSMEGLGDLSKVDIASLRFFNKADRDLVYAIKYKNTTEMQEALSSGADKNCLEGLPLRMLASEGRIDEILLVEAASSDVLDLEIKDNEAICRAAENGSFSAVMYLHNSDADIHARNDYVLRQSARHNDQGMVIYIHRHGGDIHGYDEYALRCAVSFNNKTFVEFLLENGADIHILNEFPLKEAVESGYLKMTELLLNNDADVSVDNYRVWDVAYRNGWDPILDLIEAKMTPEIIKRKEELQNRYIPDDYFTTKPLSEFDVVDIAHKENPWVLAAQSGRFNEALEKLTEEGLNKDILLYKDQFGTTILDILTTQNMLETVFQPKLWRNDAEGFIELVIMHLSETGRKQIDAPRILERMQVMSLQKTLQNKVQKSAQPKLKRRPRS